MVRIRTLPGVPKDSAQAVRDAVAKLPEFIDIRHSLTVVLAPSPTVAYDDGVGFGAIQHRGDKPPVIYLGAIPPKIRELRSEANIRLHLTDTLVHELIHYEQWRDGKPYHHRGVERRAHRISSQIIDRLGVKHGTVRWQMTSRQPKESPHVER